MLSYCASRYWRLILSKSNHCLKPIANDSRVKNVFNKSPWTQTTSKMSSATRLNLKSDFVRARIAPHLLHQIDYLFSELDELNQLRIDSKNTSSEKELNSVINEEERQIKERLAELEAQVIDCLIVEEDEIANQLVLECAAGVGGQEAMLFTKEMFNIYARYVADRGWSGTVLKSLETDIGGAPFASLVVEGMDCYRYLRHEAGVHRVQRIPKTEASGRVHTSTITVAILPVRRQFQSEINPKELEMDFTRSSAPGGQNVNKRETCVRIKHLPTGLAVECQEQRSQEQNKQVAMIKLQALLNNIEYDKRQKEESRLRKSQIGIAHRAEKIRTYNFNQDRITDHRLHANFHNIAAFMTGGSNTLHDIILRLEERRREELISQIISLGNS